MLMYVRTHDTAACIADIFPSGYSFRHRPHSVGRSVGIGLLLSDHFNVNSCLIPDYSTFEFICVEISYSSFSAYFVCLHRSLGQPATLFEESQDLLGFFLVILIFIWINLQQ